MKSSTSMRALAVACAAFAAAGQAQAQDTASTANAASGSGTWRLSLGGNYSVGDYGDPEDTEIFSIPATLRYTNGNLNIRVSVPYVFLDGPGSLIDTPIGNDSGGPGSGGGDDHSGSGGPGPSGSSGGEVDDDDDDDDDEGGGGGGSDGPASRSTRGIGDVSISAVYSIPLGADFYLDANGRVKLPTASRQRRLGTGEVDFTAGADLVREFGDASVYAGGRRKFVGNSATSNFRDVWIAGAGASYRLSPGVSIGGDYYWQEGTRVGSGDISEATAWTSLRLSA
ncbi:MAG TPA: hypothetical protein VGX37_10480, partial [Allosphingosinicella sp.]|nr:hypothetical protein [Allosphingosinicella sp.]